MADFLELISQIPVVGPWIKIFVLLGPPSLIMVWLGIEHTSLLCLVCAAWLYILEKWLNIKAVVPLINIPWLWILCAGVIIGLFI